jgi:hypothetical protein
VVVPIVISSIALVEPRILSSLYSGGRDGGPGNKGGGGAVEQQAIKRVLDYLPVDKTLPLGRIIKKTQEMGGDQKIKED